MLACQHGKGGTPQTRKGRRGHPPSSVCSQCTACMGGESNPHPKGEGWTPPKQACTPFVHGLIQEIWGNPQDLSSPPLTAILSKGEGIRGDAQGGSRVGEGAPTIDGIYPFSIPTK